MEPSLPRRKDRYATFDPRTQKVSFLRRMAQWLADFVPKSQRFFIFGLPLKGPDASKGWEAMIEIVPQGIACAIGAHLNRNGFYSPELTPGAGPFIESRFLKKQRCFPKIGQSRHACASLVFEGQNNYYLWLLETLPRLRFLRESGIAYQQIYASQKKSFQRESLDLLKPPGVEIIDCEKMPFFQAPQMIVPRFVRETEPWIIPWLREQVEPHVATHSTRSHPRRFYISRGGATGRKIANEAEFQNLLGEFGFTVVALENYSWLEQIELFREAEAVVAPHGAGLANLAFCSSALVVELIADAYPFTFYPQISRQLRLDHHCLSSLPVNASRIGASDLMAPLNPLREILQNRFP